MNTLLVFCVHCNNFIAPPPLPQPGFYTISVRFCLVNTNGLRTRVLIVDKVNYEYC